MGITPEEGVPILVEKEKLTYLPTIMGRIKMNVGIQQTKSFTGL